MKSLVTIDKEQMNVYDLTQVEDEINNKPDVFIHAAAYTKAHEQT